MDKSRLVENFARLAAEEQLGIDAVRLYLFLLAACDLNGEGRIASADLRGTLGRGLSPIALKAALDALSERKLIEIVETHENGSHRGPHIRYRLLAISRRTA